MTEIKDKAGTSPTLLICKGTAIMATMLRNNDGNGNVTIAISSPCITVMSKGIRITDIRIHLFTPKPRDELKY